MFTRLFKNDIFPNRASFAFAVGLFAFNLFIICLLALLRAVHAIPDPLTQIAGLGSLEDARGLMMITAVWSIGNSVILLGLIDALRKGRKSEEPAAE